MTCLADFLRRSAAKRILAIAGAALTLCLDAQAQFSLVVSPPRFELSTRPGETVREVIELTQRDTQTGAYQVKTTDWTLRPDGAVEFSDALLPGTCRPWVAIERRELNISAGRPYRFRFEASPPADTPPVECRFAIMIEGRESTKPHDMPIALAARIGVVVYLAVGDVAPVLELSGTSVRTIDGKPTPVLKIHNSGNAHGRLAGFLEGKDADGASLELQPGTTPIMPGETREIPLAATRPGDTDTAVGVRFPATIKGKLDWGKNGSLPISQQFAP